MKKIIPFNNVLDFSTDVKEITAISLEPTFNKQKDLISGVFYINGEYKITEGLIEKETFNFELPFDIALTDNYKEETLLVDIDDFRYDLISDNKLKVNIDLYVDGEIEESKEELYEIKETIEPIIITKDISPIEETEERDIKEERLDLLKEILEEKENNMEEETIVKNENENINQNNNTFEFNNLKEEKYVTYRVYKVLENDNLETILTKYNITKEELSEYNDIENIKSGDKLIIPTNEK